MAKRPRIITLRKKPTPVSEEDMAVLISYDAIDGKPIVEIYDAFKKHVEQRNKDSVDEDGNLRTGFTVLIPPPEDCKFYFEYDHYEAEAGIKALCKPTQQTIDYFAELYQSQLRDYEKWLKENAENIEYTNLRAKKQEDKIRADELKRAKKKLREAEAEIKALEKDK